MEYASFIISENTPDIEAPFWDSIPANLPGAGQLKLWFKPSTGELLKYENGMWIPAFNREGLTAEIDLKDGTLVYKNGLLVKWVPKKE